MRKLQKKWWFPKISLPPVDKSGRVWFPFFVWHWGLPEDIAVLMLTMRKCADLFVSNLLIWSRRTTRWERRRHSSLRQRQEAAAKAAAARGWVIREDDPDASAWLAYCCPKLVAHRTPKQISPSNMKIKHWTLVLYFRHQTERSWVGWIMFVPPMSESYVQTEFKHKQDPAWKHVFQNLDSQKMIKLGVGCRNHFGHLCT